MSAHVEFERGGVLRALTEDLSGKSWRDSNFCRTWEMLMPTIDRAVTIALVESVKGKGGRR